MELSSDELLLFRTQGFVAREAFFNRLETVAIQAEIDRLLRLGRLRNVATDGDGKSPSAALKNLQLCPMYRDSPLFRSLPFHPKVVAAITQLIGDPYILHLDQTFYKPGGDGMGTSWHQDNGYFKIGDPMKGVAMWVAVHDANRANGTMRVIPGSYREEYPHSRDPYSDHHIRCYPPEERAVTIELGAGGVLFFCYGTAHCTGPNTTDQPRAGAAFHFLNVAYAQPSLIEAGRDYRPYITGPDATGGTVEYGELVAGTWESEVEKAVAS